MFSISEEKKCVTPLCSDSTTTSDVFEATCSEPPTQKNQCEHCNKVYSSTANLWKHNKICKKKPNQGQPKETVGLVAPDVLVEFIKENKELRNILVEQNKEFQEKTNRLLHHNEQQTKIIAELAQKQTITNNTTNKTTNNQFNLHFFLNDTCKDALNITDFIKSLKIQVSDLEETGRLGFVDGITRIILNGLREVELEKRPLHCTDLKRETVYIKNDNIWEKEDLEKSHLKDAVEHISNRNLQQLRPWQQLHPEFKDTTTKENDMFIHLSTQAIGSYTKEQSERNVDKILKNVLKEVVLDKPKS
jgi:hypothetical protein